MCDLCIVMVSSTRNERIESIVICTGVICMLIACVTSIILWFIYVTAPMCNRTDYTYCGDNQVKNSYIYYRGELVNCCFDVDIYNECNISNHTVSSYIHCNDLCYSPLYHSVDPCENIHTWLLYCIVLIVFTFIFLLIYSYYVQT